MTKAAPVTNIELIRRLLDGADVVILDLEDGVGPGDKVGVRIRSGTVDLYVAIAGTLLAGAAYVFRLNGTWSQQAYLKASNPGQTDYFGLSVGVSGETVVAGILRLVAYG